MTNLRAFIARWKEVIMIFGSALAVVAGVWLAMMADRRTSMRPVEGSPAAKYVEEYLDWEKMLWGKSLSGRFKVRGYKERDAPDKSAFVYNRKLFFDCRSYWVETGAGKRSRIIRMGGVERLEGAQGRHAWSEDSKVVFFSGLQHTMQCGNSPEGRVRLIHTVDDGITRRMPKDNGDLPWWELK